MKALWAIQSHCTYDCKYCYFKIHERASSGATLPGVRRIVDVLSRIPVEQVILSGGEPLEHPHCCEAISYCTRKGMNVVLTTNGAKLTRRNVELLIESGVKAIIISLDSHRREYHNSIRPIAHFDAAVNGIKEAVRIGGKHGLRVGVCMVVTKVNIGDLPDTICFAVDHGINYFKFQVIHVPVDNYRLSEFALDKEEYARLLDMLGLCYSCGQSIIMPVREKMEYILTMLRDGVQNVEPCWAGTRLIFASETGRIFPCPVMSIQPQEMALDEKDGLNRANRCVSSCNLFSSDCACLWEVAFQDSFPGH